MASLRKFPFPYEAMVAIQNDIDGTSLPEFMRLHRFLNTHASTALGRGVGLDIADSFWMYNLSDFDVSDKTQYLGAPPMSYWNGHGSQDTHNAEAIRHFLRCGWIDSLHSFGDFSRVGGFERQHAVEAIDALNDLSASTAVWINHGDRHNDQNFDGMDRGKFHGDEQGAAAYHTDITVDYGITFVWTMSASGTRIGFDSVIRPLSLWDGQQVWEFRRFDSAGGPGAYLRAKLRNATYRIERSLGLPKSWLVPLKAELSHPERLHEQLRTDHLDQLVHENQYSIIGQHLGCRDSVLPRSARRALRRLRDRQDAGDILVARTSRLLEYNRVSEWLDFDIENRGAEQVIDIRGIADPVLGRSTPSIDQLRGITFYTARPGNAHISIRGRSIPGAEIERNPSDGHAPSIGIRWFAFDRTDYTNHLADT